MTVEENSSINTTDTDLKISKDRKYNAVRSFNH